MILIMILILIMIMMMKMIMGMAGLVMMIARKGRRSST